MKKEVFGSDMAIGIALLVLWAMVKCFSMSLETSLLVVGGLHICTGLCFSIWKAAMDQE